jgi:ferric-dicitrate binding protein FerR (iron transport regulator)
MHELEQLIQKFWDNRTTLEENRRLLKLLEQYQATLNNRMEEEEMTAYQGHGLPPEKALPILQKIHHRLGLEDKVEERKKNTTPVRKLYRLGAVAASVCILVVSAFLLTGGHHEKKTQVVTATATVPRLVRVTNSSDSILPVTLADGSAVQLEKNSSLSYYEPFINDRRDISMKGIALFKVVKDKKRPFTVYACGIATTALGTKFVVNTTDSRKVMVRLLEGKVVVTTAAGSNLTMNDVYLAPGQEFSFDKASRQYVVNVTHDRVMETGKPGPPADKAELVFRKEPLGKVFQQVGRLYKVPLVFRQKELDGLYFTGTFLKSDNLDIVLSTICNVNDLFASKNGDTIIITKSH